MRRVLTTSGLLVVLGAASAAQEPKQETPTTVCAPSLSGTVRASEDGPFVSRAKVELVAGEQGKVVSRTWTDRRGKFAIGDGVSVRDSVWQVELSWKGASRTVALRIDPSCAPPVLILNK